MRPIFALMVLALAPAAGLHAQAPPPEQPAAQPPAGASAPDPNAKKKDQVYKWTDKKGVVHYTNKPPSENARPATLPPLQTYKGGSLPSLDSYQKAPPPKSRPAGPQLELVTPLPDETFRSGERTIPVAVLVTPELTATHRLVYILDGSIRSEPTMETAYAFTEVERGEHTVAVSLVMTDGTEVSAAGPVTVFVKPPTIKR